MGCRPGAVIFDLGKVLLSFDYGLAVRRVAARCRRAGSEDLRKLIVESPLLPAYERGEMTSLAFFEAIREKTGFEGDFQEFSDSFADIFEEMPMMVSIQSELRARGVPTFIFSNTNELAIRHIRRRFPFFGQFDGYVLSFEHGAMKPQASLYEVVERVSGRKGADLVYFDDLPENVEAGARRGWRAVLHHDPGESRSHLRDAGLLQ